MWANIRLRLEVLSDLGPYGLHPYLLCYQDSKRHIHAVGNISKELKVVELWTAIFHTPREMGPYLDNFSNPAQLSTKFILLKML